MKPEDLVRDLLAAEDAEARRALLSPQAGDFYIEVVGLLKDEAVNERLNDPNAALRISDIAAEVADFADTPWCRALANWTRGTVSAQMGNYEKGLELFNGQLDSSLR